MITAFKSGFLALNRNQNINTTRPNNSKSHTLQQDTVNFTSKLAVPTIDTAREAKELVREFTELLAKNGVTLEFERKLIEPRVHAICLNRGYIQGYTPKLSSSDGAHVYIPNREHNFAHFTPTSSLINIIVKLNTNTPIEILPLCNHPEIFLPAELVQRAEKIHTEVANTYDDCVRKRPNAPGSDWANLKALEIQAAVAELLGEKLQAA